MSRRSNDSNYLPSKSDKLSSMQATRADIQKQYSNASRRESRRVQKMNAMIVGSGASTAQDRGSNQQIAWTSLNPFFDPNPLSRWMRFARWYYTDPFAKKVVDIPIDDAFRKPFIIKGLTDADNKALMKAYKQLDGDRQFKRAMKQERLFGGSMIYMPIADSAVKGERSIENPINFETLQAKPNPLGMGAQEVPLNIKALNVIDIMRIWQNLYTIDYFSPDYDKPSTYTIQAMPVHIDRLIPFDGDVLFNRSIINIYMPWRANPSGFGESILTPLHDLLVRVTGTQEGAYHLVNLASCLLMKCKDLKGLGATKGGANIVAALQNIVANLSMYRAALLEADDAEITQHTATFGSVPELVMTFLVILSAACDIPATRFLGQAPGGLNATGESDLENYYDHVDSIQKNRITPKLMKLFKIIGCCLWGADGWAAREEKIEIEHPPLWNMDEKEQAESNEIVSRYMLSLYDTGMITDEQLFDELKANNIFRTNIAFDKQLADLRKKLLESESEDAFGDEGGDESKGDKKKTQVQNAEFDDSEGKWVTVRGRHIFIKKGQSLDDAMAAADKGSTKPKEHSVLTEHIPNYKDANDFADKIWPQREDAKKLLKKYKTVEDYINKPFTDSMGRPQQDAVGLSDTTKEWITKTYKMAEELVAMESKSELIDLYEKSDKGDAQKKSNPAKSEQVKSISSKGTGEKLTHEEAFAIKDYTKTGYRALVSAQMLTDKEMLGWHEGSQTYKNHANALKQAAQIEQALLKMDGWQGVSYRGLKFESDAEINKFLAQCKEGGVYRFKAFQSSSKQEGVATKGERGTLKEHKIVLLEIAGKSGRDIEKLSNVEKEREVLFMRGASFKVAKKEGNVVRLEEL